MNNYFGSSISQEELQRQMLAQRRGHNQQVANLAMLDTNAQQGSHGDPMSGMSDSPMVGGQDPMDDMISNGSDDLIRRRTQHGVFGVQYQSPQQQQQQQQQDAERNMQMMQFGPGTNNYRDFQFGGITPGQDGMAAGFDGMGGTMGLTGHTSTFPQPSMMAMAGGSNFISPDMMGNMMAFSNLNVGSGGMANMGNMSNMSNMNMDLFVSPGMSNQFGSPLDTDFSMDMGLGNEAPLTATSATSTATLNKAGNTNKVEDMVGVERNSPPGHQRDQSMDQPANNFPRPPAKISREPSVSSNQQTTPALTAVTLPMTIGSARTPSAASIATTAATPTPTSAVTTPGPQGPPVPVARDKGRDVYSKTGFDIRALWYVATRPNPQVRLGAVDMSCAFVVCDVTLNDCPIVYVSDNFQNLTGYSRHEIVGQNCRFLQAPDGKVEAGTKREFVENDAVYNLKNAIKAGKEIQQSLINYRKGGKPFLNLLTMIPIPWDTDEIRYIIGFQIDLVECPDAITGQEAGIEVSYKHTDIGQYIWTPPSQNNQLEPDSGQTLNADDVSALLQSLGPNAPVSDWHKQSWDKMLLENTDDVIHVLSLKGLFLYVSPSAKKVLEWDGSDLVGNPISSICHPSDIVPVTRELKDTASGTTVNLVFRIRRKLSGYAWFESHGSLFVEQGKGRKCIVLVGRKRPVFALQRRDLEANGGGIGDNEFWTKLSTAGMFLFVSSNVRSLLDLQPHNLRGTSIQDMMRKESRPDFGRAIERARRGRIVTCKHEVQNKRGQVLQAVSILYPGDAAEGSKPSFLLAQTKLIKASSRTLAPATGVTKSLPAGTLLNTVMDGHKSPTPGSATPTTPSVSSNFGGVPPNAAGGVVALPANPVSAVVRGSQDAALAADDNIFDELKTTRCTSWQYELRQMEKVNRLLAEELAQLLSNKKKRKRRKGGGNMVRDCANCHTRNTPEWRRGPSGNRDLCNSCGLRWAKQVCSPLSLSRRLSNAS
jgi:PAS domain S-box-containing protein